MLEIVAELCWNCVPLLYARTFGWTLDPLQLKLCQTKGRYSAAIAPPSLPIGIMLCKGCPWFVRAYKPVTYTGFWELAPTNVSQLDRLKQATVKAVKQIISTLIQQPIGITKGPTKAQGQLKKNIRKERQFIPNPLASSLLEQDHSRREQMEHYPQNILPTWPCCLIESNFQWLQSHPS